MNLTSINEILIFIIFFIPGFIMIKVFNLLVARESFDFSKGLFEVIAFSSLNYGLCSPIILWFFNRDIYLNYFVLTILIALIVMVIIPIFLVFTYKKILNSKWAQEKRIIDIQKSSWDFVFAQRESYWIIVHLKNGKKVGGRFYKDSFASSYPVKDIFISEVWKIDKETHKFERKIERSAGLLVLENEILMIELFK